MIDSDKTKCKGEAPNGTNVCAYRTGCLRFVATSINRNDYADFWKAGDDCPKYLSIPIGFKVRVDG